MPHRKVRHCKRVTLCCYTSLQFLQSESNSFCQDRIVMQGNAVYQTLSLSCSKKSIKILSPVFRRTIKMCSIVIIAYLIANVNTNLFIMEFINNRKRAPKRPPSFLFWVIRSYITVYPSVFSMTLNSSTSCPVLLSTYT